LCASGAQCSTGRATRAHHIFVVVNSYLKAADHLPPRFNLSGKEIRLRFHVDADATAEQRAKLLELTERYCVVYQTLKSPPRISASNA